MAVAVSMLALAGCSSGTTDDPTSSTPAAAPTSPAPAGDERGAIVSDVVLGQVDQAVSALGAVAHRITYRSTSGVRDGAGADVTGVVFVPAGTPPAGGWPVVSVGHGTTGVTDECAPSLYPNLLGTIGLVTPLLQRGAVVAVTDYQGLGTDDPHPYLDAPTAGYDIIDAVRAARNIAPGSGTRWAALGVSQGGQATWAAAEMADEYGDGLDFVGSANLSPAADVSPIAPEGGLGDLTLPQQSIMPFVVEGFLASDVAAEADPPYQDSDFLSGGLLENKDVLLACTGPLATGKLSAASSIGPDDVRPRSPEAYSAMRTWLADNALPKKAAGAPMMVLVGSRDNLILPQWTEAAARAACALGDSIDFRVRADQGHADSAANIEGIDWVTQRFLGDTPTNTCDQLP
ncbi:lipase [Rhodococcus sp. Leaf7]|uniref:lipase family protein n=1 Tax=unclassified Rhodococcus (in: high G+C Gram-positive bacteria) TaxID=192944 RepID=UPI0006F5C146|nr:lipase [Rhodococcus sp. Leaf7]KQU43330.1 lipase [Rhodococcus sp. Leaf247]